MCTIAIPLVIQQYYVYMSSIPLFQGFTDLGYLY